ncbi:MAG TPA: RdgB/HAM1 family non-canonical purine NTP pyrophosphatase [Nevskiaceae bacterium]|nr:RdgB/HAM1 family non-canonical purine NTP pyrophosphatase [Nevskiaceae bacterium]
MKKIVFVTTNEGKIRETIEILGIRVQPKKLNIDEIQTLDPTECVKKKAQAAYSLVKMPILVEDTSLSFEAWGKLPGVFIDYFIKTLGNQGILRLLKNEDNRRAIAQTSLCYFDGKKSTVVSGKVEGKIAKQAKGNDGFGWDPIFIPKGKNKTFAEMTSKEKNSLSIRRTALEKLKIKLSIAP